MTCFISSMNNKCKSKNFNMQNEEIGSVVRLTKGTTWMVGVEMRMRIISIPTTRKNSRNKNSRNKIIV